MQALIAQEASSLVYELMDPSAPQSVVDQKADGSTVATAVSPVVILGFNEASQVTQCWHNAAYNVFVLACTYLLELP
jgi:hypothetical protein